MPQLDFRKPRLFVDAALAAGETVALERDPAQAKEISARRENRKISPLSGSTRMPKPRVYAGFFERFSRSLDSEGLECGAEGI